MQYQAYNPGERPKPHPSSSSMLRRAAVKIGLGLCALITLSLLGKLIFALIMPFLMSFISPGGYSAFSYAVSLIAYCVILGVPCLMIVVMLGFPARVAFPLRLPRADVLVAAVLISLGLRVITGFMVSFLASSIERLTGLVPQAPAMPQPEGFLPFIIYFISIAVAPAIFEELLFRGIIMQSLRRFGDYFAVIVSSVLFALIHGNLIQGPYSLLLGMFIGYFVIYTGSLWTGVAIHFVNNATAVVLENILRTQGGYNYEIFAGIFLMASVLLAVFGLVYMRRRYGSLFYLKRGNHPLPESRKQLVFFTAVPVLVVIGWAIYESWGYLA